MATTPVDPWDSPIDPEEEDHAALRLTEEEQARAEILATIAALLDTEEALFAFSTLAGIRETIERTGRVTAGQQGAIANIQRAVLGKCQREGDGGVFRHGRGMRRRYEGWGRDR